MMRFLKCVFEFMHVANRFFAADVIKQFCILFTFFDVCYAWLSVVGITVECTLFAFCLLIG